MTIIRSPRIQRDFTILSNSVCLDSRLTMRALGVLVRLLARPDNWRTNSEGLAAEFGCGRDAVRGALHELQKAGYIRMQKAQNGSGHWSSSWLVFDEPQAEDATTDDGKPDAGKPEAGIADTGKPGPITRTDETRTDVTRTDVGKAPQKCSAEPTKPRASRLPQDWALTKPLGEWAMQELGMTPEHVRTEAAKFIDYWHAKAGRDATKADWSATWRNWCRKAVEDAARAPVRSAGPESFRERDARVAAEQVKRLTGGLVHDRAALGEPAKREPLPFERGYVAPATAANTIEGSADARRIR
jgi:hypothetical protein